MNLLEQARYGNTRQVQLLADHPEVRLVLFSLQQGQEVQGQGEPRVHLLCLQGQGVLWAGDREVRATPGTLLAAEPGEAHGAKAGERSFLVLGIITPRP
ncbi:AraC family ligand binding domain-containing protein [Thermus igniterrae]|jgi:quercetin dioxygenase-like cupin family protein|uniref:AraC family ligand binding domain-containing protein n=1 Tax=Thermus igniterrae TaxID=88189 RepID=UPI0003682E7F|nr:AraC family ligand binding domain-containing protein [Thermus igniterrae]